MSKKDDDNPLEEIQKQLRDLMKNKNLQVAFAPFMQSMNPSDEDQDAEKPKDSGKKSKEPKSTKEDYDFPKSKTRFLSMLFFV